MTEGLILLAALCLLLRLDDSLDDLGLFYQERTEDAMGSKNKFVEI